MSDWNNEIALFITVIENCYCYSRHNCTHASQTLCQLGSGLKADNRHWF